MYNSVTLIGRAGSDAKVTEGKDGKTYAKFNLATNRYWKNKDGERQEKTEWHHIMCRGKTAGIAGKIVSKGSLYMISGSIEYSQFTNKDGETVNWTSISAFTIVSLSPKRSTDCQPPEEPSTYTGQASQEEDQIPF